LNTANHINDLAKIKGDLDKNNNEFIKQLSYLDIHIKLKAHKALGNFMVRHGGSMLGKSFGKWKLMAKSLTRRQLMVQNLFDHWRKYQFYYVRNSLKTWISNTKMNDMNNRHRHVMIEQNE
jgi:hypothetical protein